MLLMASICDEVMLRELAMLLDDPEYCFAEQLSPDHCDYVEDILMEISRLSMADKLNELKGTLFE